MIYYGGLIGQLQSECFLLVNNVFLKVISQFLSDRCIELYGPNIFSKMGCHFYFASWNVNSSRFQSLDYHTLVGS